MSTGVSIIGFLIVGRSLSFIYCTHHYCCCCFCCFKRIKSYMPDSKFSLIYSTHGCGHPQFLCTLHCQGCSVIFFNSIYYKAIYLRSWYFINDLRPYSTFKVKLYVYIVRKRIVSIANVSTGCSISPSFYIPGDV